MNNIITNNNIITVGELKHYVGQYVVFYYYKDYITESGTNLQRPNLPQENVSFMWMFKITQEIIKESDDKMIRNMCIYGKDFVCLIDNQHPNKITPYVISKDYSFSSAQSYARTPTKQEMNTYMKLMRHKRIFGTL